MVRLLPTQGSFTSPPAVIMPKTSTRQNRRTTDMRPKRQGLSRSPRSDHVAALIKCLKHVLFRSPQFNRTDKTESSKQGTVDKEAIPVSNLSIPSLHISLASDLFARLLHPREKLLVPLEAKSWLAAQLLAVQRGKQIRQKA